MDKIKINKKNNDFNSIAICTIFTKNCISKTRVLAKSYKTHNKNGLFFALLVDQPDASFDPEKEPFEIIKLQELAIPGINAICRKYTSFELCCTMKPFIINHLFEKYNFKKVIYLDSDIFVLNHFDELSGMLDKKSIILTPHITKPTTDRYLPDERNFLASGIYNAGFIGISKTETSKRFVCWWQKKLREYCYSLPEQGLFVDQLWLNLVPVFFQDCLVLKEPGYNVAFWNLQEQNITKKSNTFFAGKKPLTFMHMSGFDPNKAEISKYTNRFNMNNVNATIKEIFQEYRQQLFIEGYAKTNNLPCSVGKRESKSINFFRDIKIFTLQMKDKYLK